MKKGIIVLAVVMVGVLLGLPKRQASAFDFDCNQLIQPNYHYESITVTDSHGCLNAIALPGAAALGKFDFLCEPDLPLKITHPQAQTKDTALDPEVGFRQAEACVNGVDLCKQQIHLTAQTIQDEVCSDPQDTNVCTTHFLKCDATKLLDFCTQLVTEHYTDPRLVALNEGARKACPGCGNRLVEFGEKCDPPTPGICSKTCQYLTQLAPQGEDSYSMKAASVLGAFPGGNGVWGRLAAVRRLKMGIGTSPSAVGAARAKAAGVVGAPVVGTEAKVQTPPTPISIPSSQVVLDHCPSNWQEITLNQNKGTDTCERLIAAQSGYVCRFDQFPADDDVCDGGVCFSLQRYSMNAYACLRKTTDGEANPACIGVPLHNCLPGFDKIEDGANNRVKCLKRNHNWGEETSTSDICDPSSSVFIGVSYSGPSPNVCCLLRP